VPVSQTIIDIFCRRGLAWTDSRPIQRNSSDRHSTIDLISVSESLALDVAPRSTSSRPGRGSPQPAAGSPGSPHTGSPRPLVGNTDFNGIQRAILSTVDAEQARVMHGHGTRQLPQSHGASLVASLEGSHIESPLLYWLYQLCHAALGLFYRDSRTPAQTPSLTLHTKLTDKSITSE
jgi:hypothetical protein